MTISLKQIKKRVSSMLLGSTLVFGLSLGSSSAITINREPRQEENHQSSFFNKLALTLINYDHYTNIASSLSLHTLDFAEYQRRDVASKMNDSFTLAQSNPAEPLSYNEGIMLLLAGNDNLAGINELEMKNENYIASQVEIINPESNSPKSDIALLPKAETVNDIYENVYEFNIALQQKEYSMNSGIGEIMGNGNANSKNQGDLSNSNQPTYYGLQQQLVSDINEYTRERRRRRFQLFGNQQENDPTVAQVTNPVPALPTQGNVRGNSWFVFFSIGQTYANPSNLLASNGNDYVQQQLMLQQASRASIQQRTQSLYGSRMNSAPSNFRY